MKVLPAQIIVTTVLVFLLASCANIVPPAGGPRDTTPPKLIAVVPKDSSLNTRVTKLELQFDEFVTLSNPATEISVAPLIPFPVTTEAGLKKIVLKIPDSLLRANTTYRIHFGKAIQDVHENNPFKDYRYTFSTGAYFDSLRIGGKVIDAATGKIENNAIVVLYDDLQNDSCVVRQKPLYITKTEANGSFYFEGLPSTTMKIFALKDANSNMMYDGKEEMIAFSDTAILPQKLGNQNIVLHLFSESDSVKKKNEGRRTATNKKDDTHFSYQVKVDTSDIRKRTQEITAPIIIETNKQFAKFNTARFNLSYDSLGVQVEAEAKLIIDTQYVAQLKIETHWKENTVYTLRLLKGFATDSLGNETLPSKSVFRTKRQEDYAKFVVHLPTKYFSGNYLLELLRDEESIYLQPVNDTLVTFPLLSPSGYSIRVIEDRNSNKKWDHGVLFQKLQPEIVFPYSEKILLKAGWENIIDIEEGKSSK